jgi:hypothetical protein
VRTRRILRSGRRCGRRRFGWIFPWLRFVLAFWKGCCIKKACLLCEVDILSWLLLLSAAAIDRNDSGILCWFAASVL